MPCSLSFNITYNFGALHFAHCSTAHLSPPSWNSFVLRRWKTPFSSNTKHFCFLQDLLTAQLWSTAQLCSTAHLFPPSQTWPTRGCLWAGQVSGISPSLRRSPLGNGWAHGGGCLLVVLGVNVVSGNLSLTFSSDWQGKFVSCALHWLFFSFFLSFFWGEGGSMVC